MSEHTNACEIRGEVYDTCTELFVSAFLSK